MRIEIWNEDQKEEEQPLRLRLVVMRNGVELQVVDKKGVCIEGHLLSIRNSGQLYLEPDISKKYGLSLDSNGRLKVGELKC